ncbi:hypothetical protein [Kocuria sp. KH4]
MTENITTQTEQDRLRAQAQELRDQASELSAEAAAARGQLGALEAAADRGERPDASEYQAARDTMNLRSRAAAGLSGKAQALDSQADALDHQERVLEAGRRAAALVDERDQAKAAFKAAEAAFQAFQQSFPAQWLELRSEVESLGLRPVDMNGDEDGLLSRVIEYPGGVSDYTGAVRNSEFRPIDNHVRIGGVPLVWTDPEGQRDVRHWDRRER